MSKRVESSAKQRGESLLREWGVGSDDIDALRAAWGRDAAADAAIAERLGALETGAAGAALVELEAVATDKALRKEIRRSLFRLERRGIEVPRPSQPPTVVHLGAPEAEGYMSASDGNGDQILWLVKPRRGELFQLFAVVNDPAGMREAEIHPVTRKIVRAACSDLLAKHEIRVVETDWRYVDHRMSEAHRWASERNAPSEGDYLGMRNQILSAPPSEVPHPIFARRPRVQGGDEASLLAESDAILGEPELRTWFFPAEVLKPYLDEIAQAQASPLLLNEAQQLERVAQIVVRAVDETFGGAARDSYRRRLLDLAWIFHATNRGPMADRAVAVAEALAASPKGGTGIPFCEGLVRFSFTAHMRAAAESQQERARESLILTPHEAAREAAQRRGR